MSRYRGPRLRIVRRLGELPGLTRKSARRAYPPGQHGQNRKKRSEYAIRLEEKQKLRMNYGLTEKQMLRYVRKARRVAGSTGQVLLQLLEMRLDNTVFRMGMAPTIPAARQLVNHGHVTVNGRPVNIASYQCRPGEEVAVRNREASKKLVEANLQYPGLANLPSHLEFDKTKLSGKVNSVIEREWVALQVNELLVVEYYSRQWSVVSGQWSMVSGQWSVVIK
jgi:small subunit ribosomal protein S4